MDRHFYVALDSDCLRNLALLDQYVSENPTAQKKQIKTYIDKVDRHSPMVKHLNIYLDMLDCAKDENCPIRFMITQTPYYETRHRSEVQNLINKYFYAPKKESIKNPVNKHKIFALAYAYCPASINPKTGKEVYFPLVREHSSYADEHVPVNDAFAVAEATHFGAAMFVTENTSDIVDLEYKTKENASKTVIKNARSREIMRINKENGYMIQGERDIVTTPTSVSTFGGLLRAIMQGEGEFLQALDTDMGLGSEWTL